MNDWQAHETMPELEALRLDDPTRASLKAKRRVRAKISQPRTLRSWPAERRALVTEWLKRSKSAAPRWVDWLKWANPRVQLAVEALQGLLLCGWIEIEEVNNQQTRGVWQPAQIFWRDLNAIRAELGLADPEDLRREREAARIFRADDERLLALESALAEAPAQTVLARRELAEALSVWLQTQRMGTRRNFAQEARGNTKGISAAEWRWLAQSVDLAACGIDEHQPLIRLGGAGQLLRDGRLVCDLDALAGYIALTPANFHAVTALAGIHTLRVIENLTSFENQLAKRTPGELLIWLPGYAAVWWLDALAALVRHLPGQVFIACDCDPWGIELALRTGFVIEQQNRVWQPWRMDAATLRACKTLIPLSDADRRKLDQLLARDLPPALRELAQAQYDLSAKAEQEQYL